MPLYPVYSWSCLSSVRHLPYVSEENPQYFGFPVPRLYSCEWTMLLLSAEAAFKLDSSLPWKFIFENLSQQFIFCYPSLAYKGSRYSIFRAKLSVGIVGVYGIVTTHLTLMFISFCCIRIQSFRRTPSLNALNEMCLMNDIPSICMLLSFAPNSMDFVSLPLTV